MDPAIEVVDSAIVSNNIKALLKRKRLTQEEVARRVGASYRHFNRVVLGASEPSLLFAQRTSVVLGEPLSAIWTIKVRTRRRLQQALAVVSSSS